jgi:hypothetical protein
LIGDPDACAHGIFMDGIEREHTTVKRVSLVERARISR